MSVEMWDQKYALKNIQWELAKGHLRAMVAIDASMSSGREERPCRFEIVEQVIEEFIKDFEDNGLNE